MQGVSATENGLIFYLSIMNSIGIIANLVILWAIINGFVPVTSSESLERETLFRPSQMRTYSVILANSALTDLFCAVTSLLLTPM